MKREIPDVLFLSGKSADPSDRATGNSDSVGMGSSQQNSGQFDPAIHNLKSAIEFESQNQSERSKSTQADSPVSYIKETLSNLAGDQRDPNRKDVLFADLESEISTEQSIAEETVSVLSPNKIDIPSTNHPEKFNQFRHSKKQSFFESLDESQNIQKSELDSVLYPVNKAKTLRLRPIDPPKEEFQKQDSTKFGTHPADQKKKLVSNRNLRPAQSINNFPWPERVLQICSQNRNVLENWIESIESNFHSTQTQSFGIISCNQMATTKELSMTLAKTIASKKSHDAQTEEQACVLIDAELSNPTLSKSLKIDSEWSWSEEGPSDYDLHGCLIRSRNESIDFLPLNCAIETKSSSHNRASAECRYLLPSSYAQPLVERFHFIHNFAREQYKNTVVNLGSFSFLDDLGQLVSICQQFDNLLLLSGPNRNERTISQAYWQLSDMGVQNIVVIENDL